MMEPGESVEEYVDRRIAAALSSRKIENLDQLPLRALTNWFDSQDTITEFRQLEAPQIETSSASSPVADGATVLSLKLGVGGTYLVVGQTNFAFAGGARRGLRLTAAGVEFATTIVPLTSNDTTLSVPGIVRVTPETTVAAVTVHDAGGAQNHNTNKLKATLIGR